MAKNGSHPKAGARLIAVATYAPAAVGLAVLLIGRAEPSVRGTLWTGTALIMISISCFISAATEAGNITVEQEMMLSRMKIAYRPIMGRMANAVSGVCFLAGGLYLIAK